MIRKCNCVDATRGRSARNSTRADKTLRNLR